MALKDVNKLCEDYIDILKKIIQLTGAKTVLEIGGGRSPSFTSEEAAELGVSYTSNDISAKELSLAPDWVQKAEFDLQTSKSDTIALFVERYDFVFSRMVMEHVQSYERAYANIQRILKPGGVGVAFHPVLYSFPYVINRLMPETASRWLLRAIFPNRVDTGIPKFAAYYSGCRISASVRNRIRELGFSDVWQVPFFGHSYYSRFPGVRTIHAKFSRFVGELNFTPLATVALTIVRK